MTVQPEDASETIRLWPDGPPTRIDGIGDEVAYVNRGGIAGGSTSLRNISDPTLTVFLPREGTGNGVGVIVVPGGGWGANMWTHEGVDVARWLTSLGYTAFALKYRVQATEPDQGAFESRMAKVDGGVAGPASNKIKPRAIGQVMKSRRYEEARSAAADDGRRAVELAREHAARLGLHPDALGMIGFSAGAFLVVDVALDPRAPQVAFVASIYGGETRDAAVPDDAPPLFVAVAQDDILVKIVEGLHADWSATDRPSELHVFARGGHAFGVLKQGLPSDSWTDLFHAWLTDLGFGMTSARD